MRASLAEATAAVIKLTDELAASNSTPANNSAASDSTDASDAPPRKRERKSSELGEPEKKSSDDGTSASRSSCSEPTASHTGSLNFLLFLISSN